MRRRSDVRSSSNMTSHQTPRAISESTHSCHWGKSSGELEDHIVKGQTVPFFYIDLLYLAVALGHENIFHLHCFDDGQGFPGLHILLDRHIDRHNQPRHRAEKHFRGIWWRLLGHEPSKGCGAWRTDRKSVV